MSTSNNGTSLLQQKDKINQKYGGDINAYDFEASYVGDANAKNKAYADYMADKNFVNYIDTLEQNRVSAIDQAKKNESQKLQYADTRRQLMQKYIPETLLAQGIANTGYTADALLKAENNYNQYAIGAMNDRANAEQDIMKQYQDSYNEYKKEYDEKAYERFLGEQDRIAQEENDKKTLYANGIDLVNSGTYDKPQLEKWLEANGLTGDDEIYKKVVAYYDSEKKRIENAVEEELKTSGRVYNDAVTSIYYGDGVGAYKYEYSRLADNKNDRVTFTDDAGKKYLVKLVPLKMDKDEDKSAIVGALGVTKGARDVVVIYKDTPYYVDSDGNVSKIVQKGAQDGYDKLVSKARSEAGATANNPTT